ncbi:DUF2269 family protein [Pseudomonas syringae]|nr:DUF2269 family protein [Pseudomonas syringae]MBD8792325.1 DUF2269 family protein [Pseudomonas syringae]MBD8803540.1 DUF2269 family protein [Pseudomonas syringae]MBD8814713.1 DUF2269 family protein [Pseudomonas syringae]
MNLVIALKTLHITALVALLLAGLGLAGGWVKRQRAGTAPAPGGRVRRPQVWAWVAMAVCLAILPFSGGRLVHELGLSLGQAWVLSSSVLYTVGLFAWAWLLMRLFAPSGRARFSQVLAGVAGLCFIALAVLLVVRPG